MIENYSSTTPKKPVSKRWWWIIVGIAIIAIGIIVWRMWPSPNTEETTDAIPRIPAKICPDKEFEGQGDGALYVNGKKYYSDNEDWDWIVRNCPDYYQYREETADFQKTTINQKIQENIKTEYYDISGLTKKALNQQMAKLGPECDDTNCFASADWAIDWTYPIADGSTCEPVSVEVSIKYTLPRWANKNQASVSLQKDWDNFIVKLKAHEEHHKDIAVKWGNLFLDEINKINTQNYQSCRELEDIISEYHATGKIIMGCTQETEKYDDDTNHGILEGIVL